MAKFRSPMGEFAPLRHCGVAAKTITELRRVGDALESIEGVYANPQLLAGGTRRSLRTS
jgi:hypothetical protein